MMIYLSIDTTSEAYASGRVLGALLLPAVLLLVLWRVTASWRRGKALPPGVIVDAHTKALRVRRRRTVLAVLGLLGVGAVVNAALQYGPEPRAAETAAPAADRVEADTAATGARTITPPAAVDGYRLMTEEESASYREAQAGAARIPGGRSWYYDRDDDGRADSVLHIDTTQWSQKLAAEKQRDSITQEFRNFFAGAKSTDSAEYPAGPLGGRLACGHYNDNPAMSVCVWSDSDTLGTVLHNGITDLTEAAKTTLDIRNASDQRT
ncbi:hypothetical protein ACFWAR_00590 [Streptomyces sp. NPDC059917]|uniref:hypothetical protein n=1 Tax=Streptomyces sp. NPDC059917 TaxID=3347002 RepID=UPI0036494D16